MKRLFAAAMLAGCGLLPYAQQPDPMASPECLAARAELHEALTDAASPRRQPGVRHGRAREQAAAACLGPGAAKRERSGAPQPLQAVPAPLAGRGQPSSLPDLAPAPGPVAIPRPSFVTACDSTGCWDSEGRRLNNTGPPPVGQGPCRVHGGMVTCP